PLQEPVEDNPVVAVAGLADDVRGGQEVVGVEHAGTFFQESGHFVDAVDEGERTYAGEFLVDGVQQGEQEPGELGDGARHVAEHDEVGSVRLGTAQGQIHRHAAVRQAAAAGAAHVEPAVVGGAAACGHPGGEA